MILLKGEIINIINQIINDVDIDKNPKKWAVAFHGECRKLIY